MFSPLPYCCRGAGGEWADNRSQVAWPHPLPPSHPRLLLATLLLVYTQLICEGKWWHGRTMATTPTTILNLGLDRSRNCLSLASPSLVLEDKEFFPYFEWGGGSSSWIQVNTGSFPWQTPENTRMQDLLHVVPLSQFLQLFHHFIFQIYYICKYTMNSYNVLCFSVGKCSLCLCYFQYGLEKIHNYHFF